MHTGSPVPSLWPRRVSSQAPFAHLLLLLLPFWCEHDAMAPHSDGSQELVAFICTFSFTSSNCSPGTRHA